MTQPQPPRPPFTPPGRPPIPPPRRTYGKVVEERPDASNGAALFGGAVAALVGAALWTGLVVLTKYEVSWFAWGVGALVGFVMSRMAPVKSTKLAIAAALLAVLGLAVGKIWTVKVLLPQVGRQIVMENPRLLTQAFAIDMASRENFSHELSYDLRTRLHVDAVTPRMLDSLPPDLLERVKTEAVARMSGAPPAERERVAVHVVGIVLAPLTFGLAFAMSLSLFDFVWFGLAIATAWKLTNGD